MLLFYKALWRKRHTTPFSAKHGNVVKNKSSKTYNYNSDIVITVWRTTDKTDHYFLFSLPPPQKKSTTTISLYEL
jgi:hypothetical protein